LSDKNLEQRIDSEFCVESGETLALLTLAYGELSVTEWNRRFKEGQDDPQKRAAWLVCFFHYDNLLGGTDPIIHPDIVSANDALRFREVRAMKHLQEWTIHLIHIN
jgi:hypothetical protein